MQCYIPEHDILLVDIGILFDNVIEIDIINRLREHGLLVPRIKLKNPDTIKIIYHYVIYHICEYIKNVQKGKVILCLTGNELKNCEIFNYCSRNMLLNFLKTLFKRIQRNMPIVFADLSGICTIQDFCEGIKMHRGEYIEQLEKIIAKISKLRKTDYTLKNAKKFTIEYQLYLLSREYFNELKVKSALATR